MTNKETARWEALKRAHAFNQAHATELAAIPDYKDEADDLAALLPQIEAAAAMQQQDNTGKTVNKDALQATMGSTVVMYSKRAIVKAHRLGNAYLEEALDHPLSYYTQGAAALCIARATATKNLLKDNLATLTNLTAADIAALEKAIADFEAAIGTPQTAGQAKKVRGTDQIDPLLDKGDRLMENMNDLLDSYLPDSLLAAEFELTTRLIELGVRSNSVTLTVQDATTGNPIAGAAAANESGTKNAVSTTGGVALFESIRTGTQNFTVSATGYAAATLAVKVARGKNTEQLVKLDKMG